MTLREAIAAEEGSQGNPLAGLDPELAATVGRLIGQLPAGFRWPRIIGELPPRQRAVAMCVVGRLARSEAGAEPLSARAFASRLGVSHTLARRVLRRLSGAGVVADITEFVDPRLDREHQGRARVFALRWDPLKRVEVEPPHTPRRRRGATPPSAGTPKRPGPRPAQERTADRGPVGGNRWVLYQLRDDLRRLPRLHRDAVAVALYRIRAKHELDNPTCRRLVENLPALLARGRPSARDPRRVHGWAAALVREALELPHGGTAGRVGTRPKPLDDEPPGASSDHLQAVARDILNDLNDWACNWSEGLKAPPFPPTEANLRPIIRRLRQGYTRGDLEAVIMTACPNPDDVPFSAFLQGMRPPTLFGPRFLGHLQLCQGLARILDEEARLIRRREQILRRAHELRAKSAPESELERLRAEYRAVARALKRNDFRFAQWFRAR